MTEREVVFEPQRIATLALEELARRRTGEGVGVRSGIELLDRTLRPLRPGDLLTILGRPSHYKSGLCQWWARALAQRSQKTEDMRVTVYVTWEMPIEELAVIDLSAAAALDATEVAEGKISDQEWKRIQAAAMTRAALPFWYIGHSIASRKRRIRLTLYAVERALHWIEDNLQFRARCLFLDYLQLILPQRTAGQEPARRVDITETVATAKDLALSLGCPVVLVAQAHRRVDERRWKLPMMADAMESAAIEQYSDAMVSLWMPKVTDPIGKTIKAPGGREITVSENLLVMGLVKQKRGPSGTWIELFVDPTRNVVGRVEHREELLTLEF